MKQDYRQCMDEIEAVLKKYDMAGDITIVSKERAMFKFFFPTWSTITIENNGIRFRSKKEDFSSKEEQVQATELSAHIVCQMRDIAGRNFAGMQELLEKLQEHMTIFHNPLKDFKPETD